MPLKASSDFKPSKARQEVIRLLEKHLPQPNPNRWRMSATAKSLTFGAQTGRGSDNGCVINRTYEAKYARLIEVGHKLAQAANGTALPYLGFQILKLERGQTLNQHRDYHNHPDYPNRTMRFGQYTGGSLQTLRVTHRVTEVIRGNRYSITLLTPGKLDRLTPHDWDALAKYGFRVYLYDVTSIQVRRLPAEAPIKSRNPKPTAAGLKAIVAAHKLASSSSHDDASVDLWKKIPLPNIADTPSNC